MTETFLVLSKSYVMNNVTKTARARYGLGPGEVALVCVPCRCRQQIALLSPVFCQVLYLLLLLSVCSDGSISYTDGRSLSVLLPIHLCWYFPPFVRWLSDTKILKFWNFEEILVCVSWLPIEGWFTVLPSRFPNPACFVDLTYVSWPDHWEALL